MASQIQLRRDTAANWASNNPILAQGEMGYEIDTGKFKFGNGATAWASLAYATGTAAAKDIPATGNASISEVVYGTDTRLSDARTASGGNAATVTTNANLTGHITSVGNAAVLGSFTLAQLNTAVDDADLQVALVSGTNIKTVNSSSLLGTGDLLITGGLAVTPIRTSAYTAVVNDLVRVDSTSGAFTVTLPSATADGDKVGLLDISNKCGTNAVLMAAAGGKTIEGDGTGLSVNVNGAYIYLIYNSTGTNWKLAETPHGSGDITGGLTTSVDSEVMLFSGTGGKTVKRASVTGIAKLTSGVLSAGSAGTDYSVPTGTETLTNKTLKNPTYTRQVLSDASIVTWDCDNGANALLTVTASRTMGLPTNLKDSSVLTLKIIQGGSGSCTITWNAIFKWPGGVAPVLSTAVGAYDIISCYYDGTYINGSYLRGMA